MKYERSMLCSRFLHLLTGIDVWGCRLIWLVVLTILKNISQWEGLPHILWKIKNVWNHQPVMPVTLFYDIFPLPPVGSALDSPRCPWAMPPEPQQAGSVALESTMDTMEVVDLFEQQTWINMVISWNEVWMRFEWDFMGFDAILLVNFMGFDRI